MKKYMISALLGIAGGAVLSLMWINPYTNQTTLSEMVLQLSGSIGYFIAGTNFGCLMEIYIRLIPGCLFMFIHGIAIYRHYCTASIYVFSRVTDRKKWLMQECFNLSLQALLFAVLETGGAVGVGFLRYQVEIDTAGLILAGYWILLKAMWVLLWTLLVNLGAILSGGSDKGFVISYGLQGIFLMGIGTLDFMVLKEIITESQMCRLLPWSLLSHLIVAWHKSVIPQVDAVLSGYIQVSVETSLLLFAGINGILIGILGYVVQRKDLLGSTGEGK
jgi:hypothetical protein